MLLRIAVWLIEAGARITAHHLRIALKIVCGVFVVGGGWKAVTALTALALHETPFFHTAHGEMILWIHLRHYVHLVLLGVIGYVSIRVYERMSREWKKSESN